MIVVIYTKAESGFLDAAFILCRHAGGHDSFSLIGAAPPPTVLTGLALSREERGAAIVEMALVLPLLLALLMGVLVYGQYFMLAHSVQQAANDGARAAIVGLDAADRRVVATRAVGRSLQAVSGTQRRGV
jgi:Flp pilus assembly protein TadG